ncbi:hypothetical protein AAC387_Pa03g1913 [Persea americana]
MNSEGQSYVSESQSEEEMDMRRGPWTTEEDLLLVNYISKHGEGRWNSLSQCAGLKRTGKSCRLRWLNYLRPDVRRGNITLEEQLLILELHSRWGNRWSKIAQFLPGRTDNEIKNYWRTRVQKQAKQLKCDVNSKQFKDNMRYVWMPRLIERIQAASSRGSHNSSSSSISNSTFKANSNSVESVTQAYELGCGQVNTNLGPEQSSNGASSDSVGTQLVSEVDCSFLQGNNKNNHLQANQISYPETLVSPHGYFNHELDFSVTQQDEWFGGDIPENVWSMEDIWGFEEQLSSGL